MNTLQLAKIRNISDEDVMELFQGGYEEAFNEIVLRYREKIHNFIYRYTRNHLDCEDIVQETFFRVYRCKHSYERIARFSTWLYTIANNLVRSHYKKSSKLQAASIHEVDSNEQEYEIDITDNELRPDDSLNENMMMEYVQKALELVPDEFKDIVIMRDLQNLTYEEIMEITSLPMGTVKSRINRGRVRLQIILKTMVKEEQMF